MKLEGKSQQGFEHDCKFNGDCFVAGTLVHTDKGLVPIEQLKVGDMVLSKHESGEGEQAYKRVMKMFKSEEKRPIYRVKYTTYTILESLNNSDSTKITKFIFCTEQHPFLIVDKSWVSALNLETGNEILLSNNEKGIVIDETLPIYETALKDVGYSYNQCAKDPLCDIPCLMVDFRSGVPQLLGGEGINCYSDWNYWHESENILELSDKTDDPAVIVFKNAFYDMPTLDQYTATVYNLEVEDFHTYYVGNAGIWVHNASSVALNDCVSKHTLKQ